MPDRAINSRHLLTQVSKVDIDAINASELFDAGWYLQRFPDVSLLGMAAAEHYLWIGARLSRNPSPDFDGNAYLAANEDIAECGINPLLHYVRYGKDEGRSWAQGRKHRKSFREVPLYRHVQSLPPDLEMEITRLPLRSTDAALVDVVIPVYRGKIETLSCIWHVLKSLNITPHQVVVIDDKSPEPELSAALERIAATGHIQLLRNDANLGFVKTVNRGMRLHESRDIILLNSDTEVFGDWIDRLHATAGRIPFCGTLTPLTNNGTVCSYPFFADENDGTLELSFEELDRLASQVNRGEVVETPTAVGFCMYIKRKLIREIGSFDDEAFGRGYGEENDFCLRGQRAGWKDLIATDTFVRHLGSVSFQGEKAELARNNLKVLETRHPGYQQSVSAYLREDPARPLRARLDLARLKRLKRERNVLIISHTRGGGVERCVRDAIGKLEEEGAAVFVMQAVKQNQQQVVHFHSQAPDVPNLAALDLRDNADEIIRTWNELSISEVHIHHVIDHGAIGATNIHALMRKAGIRFEVTVHDYFWICPRITLHDEDGVHCGEPDDAGCNSCLRTRGEIFGVPDIAAWRRDHGGLLRAAFKVRVPDADVAKRLLRYFPDVSFEVAPHEGRKVRDSVRAPSSVGARVRVGVLGGISDIKGFGVLLECAADARLRGLPLDFVVIGFTRDDRSARAAGIEITGAYAEEQLQQRIAAANLDSIFLSSTVPETYSYTLSAALQTDLPIVVFDIGAPARRVRGVKGAFALPLDLARQPQLLNMKLLERLRTDCTSIPS
jgi:GT2 family glycosyltransferase